MQTVLLTATITPPTGAPILNRVDPDLRRADYRSAFDVYLKQLGQGVDRLVFAENSNSDLSDFHEAAARAGRGSQVELLPFSGLNYPTSHGRLYGELRLIEYAMTHAKFLAEGPPDQVVWKSTGRYTVRNFPAVIRHQPKNFDIYINLRNYPRRWVDTYLMAWRRPGYEGFLKGLADRYIRGAEGTTPDESAIRGEIDAARSRLNVAPRFTRVPFIDGKRGWDNKNYSNKWDYMVRVAASRIAPALWI